jgi:NAD(P)-dependent dehydrogenase (short-subunit alcohol dehydrogenase family)
MSLAVVTGGTRGIGHAIATRLIESGHECLVTGRSAERPASTPAGARYRAADFEVDEELLALADLIGDLRPSILVNNAGINIGGDTASFALEDYDRLQRVNLRAPFVLIRAALPAMLERRWGRIVNVTSIWGVAGNRRNAAYCASKFGLDGLTVSVAAEVAPTGILVNAVAPGYIATETTVSRVSAQDAATATAAIPMGRMATPGEVAAFVAWLVSADNTYLTGQNIVVDGGLTRTSHPLARDDR